MQLLSDLDIAIIGALQRAPRAPLHDIAGVLGVSPSTVSRRFAALRQSSLVDVTVSLNWGLTGRAHPSVVWISCRTGYVQEAARQIAALPQVQSVMIVTGRFDLQCILHHENRHAVSHTILETLSAIPGVKDLDTHIILSTSRSSREWRIEHPFTPSELDRLAGLHDHPNEGHPIELDAYRDLINLLLADGRISVNEISEKLSISRSTAARTLSHVLSSRSVRLRVDVEPLTVGFDIGIVLQLSCLPAGVRSNLEALGAHPLIRFAALTLGDSFILVHADFRNEEELESFITHDVAALKHVTDVSISTRMRTLKHNWRTITDGRVLSEMQFQLTT
jgi:DNA-binding Lrp family transcriptional regulator